MLELGDTRNSACIRCLRMSLSCAASPPFCCIADSCPHSLRFPMLSIERDSYIGSVLVLDINFFNGY